MKCLLGVMKRPFRDTNVEHLRVTCMLFCAGSTLVSSPH